MSLHAEQQVLGAILLGGADIVLQVSEIIEPIDFSDAMNGKIFSRMVGMVNDGIAVDFSTVISRCNDGSMIAYVAELVSNTASAKNAELFAAEVKKLSTERKLLQAGEAIKAITSSAATISEKLESAHMILNDISEQSTRSVESINDHLKESIGYIEDRIKNKGIVRGLETGFVDLDNRLMGIDDTDLVIIAARPSMGKTSLALNIAGFNAIHKKKPVYFCSMEMTPAQLVTRLISSECRVPAKRMKDGTLDDNDLNKLAGGVPKLKDIPLIIDGNVSQDVMSITAAVKKAERTHGKLSCIIIDYLTQIEGKGQNQNDKISNISRQLKKLAMSMRTPVICLAQLNRGVEQRSDKRPMMSDLRDSGAIEQDADIVMMLYRDDAYNENSQDKGTCEILVRKFRNGETGTDRVASNLHYCRFDNLGRA